MKFLRMTLAATAAAFLLTASLAAACEGKAQATSASAGHPGCAAKAGATTASGSAAKAGATTVSGSGCTAKAGATTASGGGCCAKNKAATAGGGCADKAKAGGCGAKGEPVMASVSDSDDASACKFKAGAVSLKGTVLCNHCNLKKSETCQTMFQTESGCLFALSGDKVQALREAAVGGGKLVKIKGEVNASGELALSSYRVVRTLDTGASAM